MAEPEKNQTLYYKKSTSLHEGGKGIEAVVVTTKEELVKAGLDVNTAGIVMKNLSNPFNGNERLRLVVVRDGNDKPIRVFGGHYSESYYNNKKDENGQNIKNKDGVEVREYVPSELILFDAVDLKKPDKTTSMEHPIILKYVDPKILRAKDVDKIQDAIEFNRIGKANPVFDELLEKGATVTAKTDSTGVQVPSIPKELIAKAGKGGGFVQGA